ncbi:MULTISPECIES: YihY/virulence factor BrkB family protein [Fusobacterium]|jgi:membrane protein|uniref:YihY family inner membrane protein n=1 Tax=Fusobacterium ulcerans TaxID=861 RepID=A0AAX2J8Y0_9FUSO|nr:MULTISPECIES: YihY/virulence factor BrkB family protein [Fusobacterium]AVQ28559.1 YihY/virulence factor BrkB family protein [Fusobacterium ulcerans]EFS26029.1 YihY family protein [Fusobacterium ulcerans ATCC 49185]MCB8566173.1 YihY/virulence factor BrkB family protein [Fusobacterium ulcerans]MCB8650316.1 YihY/virulence factor BrkB family protein [Fusobacterium ulcerans]SQJ00444.1 YihY family inner membrane protein [Fusobacterium ulcerans]
MNIKRKLIYFFKEVASQGKISNIISGIQRALENYKRANSALWVTSLCFYTLLSLVPVFAILFSLGSWLGVAESIIIHLSKYSPLNEEMITFLVQFSENLLENARSGVLAGIGFLSLGWTLITMFSIVEKSFNDIWQVEKSRMILRKITDYIAFFLLFPLLILTINGGMVIIGKKLEGIYDISPYLLQVIPSLSIFLFFTALYMLIPNTKVKLIPAFFSAVFTSVLFSGLQYFFIHLQVMIITYNKIYGSFSVIFIFFLWLKIMWFFIILGAHLSYFLQNKDLKSHSNDVNSISFKSKEYAGMIVIRELIRRYSNNLSPVTVKELAEKNDIPYDLILYVLTVFEKNGLAAKVINVKNEDEASFTILQNIDQINFKKVFNVLESSGEDIRLQVNDDNRAFYKIIKNKDFDFLIKDLLENSK